MKSMEDRLLNWLAKTEGRKIRPRVICADGYSISIQATPMIHACKIKWGRPVELELGFPSGHDDLLTPYQDEDMPIYRYVPVKVVAELIAKHGGFL